jgi:energy-converting hydrogenase Eha subunit H
MLIYIFIAFQKISLQNKDLEIENSRLQERLIALKDENEKIQNVVGKYL